MMTKRPKLLPQVPMSGGVGAAASRDLSNHQQTYSSANISDTIRQQQPPPTVSGFSFDVYGTHSDPYRTSSDCSAPFNNTIDNEYDYESEMAAVCVRPARTRRKVLPSAPRPPLITNSSVSQQYNDEFENEPLSYNSQPPAKFDDHR